ncbi:hypothetical protein BEL04_08445 [Mucilaginibacter sp. PPCGB 2223]|uniref:PD-(D/E)XK nuclease family protein n=1 Tax=Mucilaginibacter sp. PPCGB 2223 TaxID=1886027 RepID=UPI000824A5F0|nr:PD-(D/E)XK nuclease family protein [Mucilaginibacter sp. PPCGB 2223]OCX54277.1 hypothetical protein BEL04_08445 [Mucilaginibacter sp. PPCGB 2223]
MPFKHFLGTSLDFERTHQLILQCLFNDPLFLKVMTGMEPDRYQVQLEPLGGLFDIGILDNDKKYVCLIELKMWSGLSDVQLERQAKHLESQRCPGMHILLGTTDLQFHRDQDYDELAERAYDHSCKIGYQQLIGVLDTFIVRNDPALPVSIIAANYRDALSKQAAYLDGAWLDPYANPHFRAYSAYSKIKRYLLDECFYIYSVNNAGGAAYILNDANSWTKFTYKGHELQIYQEMLDLQLMIRIYGDGAPNHIKNQLKDRVIKELKRRDKFNLPWCFESKSSKYHKIAIYKPPLQTMEDCMHIADIFKFLNPVLKEIAKVLEDNTV